MNTLFSDKLIERLPQVEGTYEENVALSSKTWFRVGGPAEVFYRPRNEDDLVHFLQNKPANVPITVIGVGSNVLVRDGGIPGVVIKLSGGFSGYRMEGEVLHAGAATPDIKIALSMQEEGIGGLEFLRGVPGTLGGAVRMNAGAYGAEIADVFVACIAVDPDGERHPMGADDVSFSYRHSSVPEDWIITRIALQGAKADPKIIAERMADISDTREESQPTKSRTGGSTFKNPPSAKAWELIDQAGCRGLRFGDAQISELHCNFMINLGAAKASELEQLGEEVRKRVQADSGISLEWEIRIIGEAAPDGRAA